MSWRKVGFAILFSPVLVGLVVFLAIVVVLKLPMFCCERCRGVRFLPYTGLAYYVLAIPLLLIALGLTWWEALIGTGLFALGGDWLLPDPVTFLFNSQKRRAVRLAIEYVESEEGPWPIYSMVGVECGRTIVSVPIKSETMPLVRRFLAVADEVPKIEELDFEYVSTKHSIRAWR